jgi:hypothetical protein
MAVVDVGPVVEEDPGLQDAVEGLAGEEFVA